MFAFYPLDRSASQRITHTQSLRRAWLVALGIAGSFVEFDGQAAAAAKPVTVSETSFRCMTQMTKVRGFYVDNLLSNKRKTLAVASAKKGGVYPPGSVVQLVPTEVMVKQPPGTSPATKD